MTTAEGAFTDVPYNSTSSSPGTVAAWNWTVDDFPVLDPPSCNVHETLRGMPDGSTFEQQQHVVDDAMANGEAACFCVTVQDNAGTSAPACSDIYVATNVEEWGSIVEDAKSTGGGRVCFCTDHANSADAQLEGTGAQTSSYGDFSDSSYGANGMPATTPATNTTQNTTSNDIEGP